MRGVTMAAAAATMVLVAGCTGDTLAEGSIDAREPSGPPADTEHVPEFCDDLMSTLVPTKVLRLPLPPARSYARLMPDPQTGRANGLRCEHGIDFSGPTLTVTATEFRSPEQARAAFRSPSSVSSQFMPVRDLPGVLRTESSSTSLSTLDADCVVQASLRAGVIPPEGTEPALRAITAALLDGIEGGAA